MATRKDKDTETRLLGLATLIKEIYIPAMGNKQDITHVMNKFMAQIHTSIHQAYGNVEIDVPEIPADMSNEEVLRDHKLMDRLQAAVVSTTSRISRHPTLCSMVHPIPLLVPLVATIGALGYPCRY